MRIMYLSDAVLPSASANSVHVMKMCEAFADLGHQVILVGIAGERTDLFDHYGVERNFSIELTNVPLIPGRLYFHALLSQLILKKYNPDFIYGRSFHGIFLQSILFRRQYAFESHDPFSTLPAHFQYSFKKILSTKRFSFLVVISEALREIIMNELPQLNASKIIALHDGATIVKNLGVSKSPYNSKKIQVGYIGTIGKGRGIDLLVECAKEVPEFDFHIIGGTYNDVSVQLGLSTVSENIFFHGFVKPAEASAMILEFDILVAPYQKETTIRSGKNTSSYMSPIKIFEYMASKKAIVSSDLPVLREVLNEENCILVDPENKLLWVQTLLRLKDEALRKSLSNKAFDDFEKKYSWKIRAEKILSNL